MMDIQLLCFKKRNQLREVDVEKNRAEMTFPFFVRYKLIQLLFFCGGGSKKRKTLKAQILYLQNEQGNKEMIIENKRKIK